MRAVNKIDDISELYFSFMTQYIEKIKSNTKTTFMNLLDSIKSTFLQEKGK